MSTAMPQVPPRPVRTHDQPPSSSLASDIPKIPPRPINRRIERSVSPHRESFARSPLNESPFLGNHSHKKSSLYPGDNGNISAADLPGRPPSVSLPSIGQEGSEYAEVCSTAAQEELSSSPPQTRNIGNDLKLHAPKPSLPTASAKQRVSTVTRTDSSQAAAFGIGKASSDDKAPESRSLKNKASFASQTSNGNKNDRPSSIMEGEHGIPEIGIQVPMYPNAGDVQAPSPAPFAQVCEKGIGFHNDGSKPRHHGRKLSARGHEIPPDAYGRYGHGVIPHDRFEKAYYEKHPELFKKELGQYGDGRGEWAMSSEDLNKIVRDTASRGAGLGTSPIVMSTPSEQIGFQASEEYASRMSSPRMYGAHGNTSETHVDSPLGKESFAAESGTASKSESKDGLSRSLHAPSDLALASEAEDDDIIHVDAPGRRSNKIYGGSGSLHSAEDLEAEYDAPLNDHGYTAPILASDEVAKEPFGWELQPAVSPMNEHRSLHDDAHHRSGSQSSQNGSRPSSRPGSIHGTVPGLRLPESTHLEDLDEYEPLFPEEEKKIAAGEKPVTTAERLKRPELKNRKFPSQDIWEDTPSSLQYTATVSTPQLPEDKEEEKQAHNTETPAQAFARRQEELAEQESKTQSFLHQEKKSWANKAHLASEARPGLKQRFPSRDIWEDTPDSLQLQTTVAAPQSDEAELLSPPEERPTTGAVVYHQEKAAAGFPLGSEEGRATTGIAAIMKPVIPTRPAKSSVLSKSPEKAEPVIPDRPSKFSKQVSPTDSTPPIPTKTKPLVPVRPSKQIARESSENIPLSTVPSNSSAKSIPSDSASLSTTKAKPPVPSRPLGSKIAALQGGFMSDLNKRLQLGPQAPKKEEEVKEEQVEEKEKVPLSDARKGRARGPQRRAPAKSASPSPAVALDVKEEKVLHFSIPSCVWSIDPDENELHVSDVKAEAPAEVGIKTIKDTTPALTTKTAGESLHDKAEIAPEAEKIAAETAEVEHVKDLPKKDIVSESTLDSNTLKSGDGEAAPASSLAPEELGEEDLSASTATLKPAKKEVDMEVE